MNLRWAHMFEGTFSDVTVHIVRKARKDHYAQIISQSFVSTTPPSPTVGVGQLITGNSEPTFTFWFSSGRRFLRQNLR